MYKTTLCYIEKDGQYLMMLRNKKKNDENEGKLIGVGGKFEPGETADMCLLREVYEETGLTLTDYEFRGIVEFRMGDDKDQDMYLYTASGFTGTLKETCYEGEFVWVPIDKIMEIDTWEGDYIFLKYLKEGRSEIYLTLTYNKDVLVNVEERKVHTPVIKSSLIHVKHGFSTRIGGVSTGIFESLNLGRNRGDDWALVRENWKIFGMSAGIPCDYIGSNKQVHSANVRIVKKVDLRAIDDLSDPINADGLVTNEKGLPLMVVTADCVPLLLCDDKAGVIAAVHCGWRSTVADIEKNTIDTMISLGADPKNIKGAVGPAICKNCFEVGEEVIEAACKLLNLNFDTKSDMLPCNTNYYYIKSPKNQGKYLLDLKKVVLDRLIMLGVPADNLDYIDECTMHNPDMFWSHRYTNGVRGSQASIITL